MRELSITMPPTGRRSIMRKSLLALLTVLLPACAAAQGTATPPTAPAASPRGPDTPTSTIPGGTATVTPTLIPSNDAPIPAVDSSGANRSTAGSASGEAKAPIGAPRLPGEPSNPPTGPSE